MNKNLIREEYLHKRMLLNKSEVASKTEEVNDNLFMDLTLQPFTTLHIFLPITEKNEINTWLIIERLRKFFKDKRIVVPRCNFEKNILESVILEPAVELTKNKWGIPEPATGQLCSDKEIDVVFLPLVAFDKNGNRVGYGKGHYDKFLKSCRENVVKVGLSLFPPVEEIEQEAHDISLDAAVTPDTVYFFR